MTYFKLINQTLLKLTTINLYEELKKSTGKGIWEACSNRTINSIVNKLHGIGIKTYLWINGIKFNILK